MAETPRVANAASREHVAHGRRKEKSERRQQANDLREVLATPAGARVLWRVLEHAGMFLSVFSENPGRMAFLEGARNEALWLVSEINAADPQAIVRMMTAAQQQAERESNENAAAHAVTGDD